EKDTSPVQILGPCSGATMNRAAVLADAAAVWREPPFAKLDPAFSRRCLDESLKSWRLLERKPHPWPADPAKPGKMAYGGWWFTADYQRCRALSAACYFRLTDDQKYHTIVKEIAATWKHLRPGEDGDMLPAIWVYLHTPGADPELKKRLRKMVLDVGDAVVKQTGRHRGYAAGLRGYWWGSNRMVGHCGLQAVAAAELAGDAKDRARYIAAAEEFVHYLLGRNPLGLCYVTNLKALGAERSAMVAHHGWVGNANSKIGQRFVGEGDGKIGPFPGLVVGGANGGMKKYVDELDWRKKHSEYNEPCLTYQSPCAAMLRYVALRSR
ncbi:MAG: glycoside hydrolase family 9 protein, partial [Phycisphaerae bacterium]